jgi:hypothetical protein
MQLSSMWHTCCECGSKCAQTVQDCCTLGNKTVQVLANTVHRLSYTSLQMCKYWQDCARLLHTCLQLCTCWQKLCMLLTSLQVLAKTVHDCYVILQVPAKTVHATHPSSIFAAVSIDCAKLLNTRQKLCAYALKDLCKTATHLFATVHVLAKTVHRC